jgi:hypothetical protein
VAVVVCKQLQNYPSLRREFEFVLPKLFEKHIE